MSFISYNEIQHVVWNMPPSRNRNGFTRGEYDRKHIIVIESDMFGTTPTLITSDLHSCCNSVFKLLDMYFRLDKFLVITAGDMAGPPIFGYDGDPTEDYEFMLSKAKQFYFVQGNHDLPGVHNKQDKLKNKDGTFCGLRNGKRINTDVGTMAGVNGTISSKAHPYKMHEKKYLKFVSDLIKPKKTKPRILVTHETPALPFTYPNSNKPYPGNDKLFELSNHHKPCIHIYGHCHHPKYHYFMNGVHYLNVDARVLIFKPESTSMDNLLKQEKELTDLYFHENSCDTTQ